ncbi:MAG: hypothetical protein R2751_04400 [Bacteroidales bacterium]
MKYLPKLFLVDGYPMYQLSEYRNTLMFSISIDSALDLYAVVFRSAFDNAIEHLRGIAKYLKTTGGGFTSEHWKVCKSLEAAIAAQFYTEKNSRR